MGGEEKSNRLKKYTTASLYNCTVEADTFFASRGCPLMRASTVVLYKKPRTNPKTSIMPPKNL